MTQLRHILGELKRRNVYRAAGAYLALAWLVVQIADILLNAYAAPDWAIRAIFSALVIGFPVTVVLAWVYEITVEGVRRTEDVLPDQSITSQTGRKIDFIIIGLLFVAVSIFAIDRFMWRQFGDDEYAVSNDFSVAVLPFTLTSREVAPYFGQLSHEISRLLERSRQIRVASTDAVEAVPGNSQLTEVAERLGVRYVVGGTVTLTGASVNLTAFLFDRVADEEIWRRTFEKLELQETINSVTESIVAEMNSEPLLVTSTAFDPRLYELHLRAEQQLASGDITQAENLLRGALGIDARFPLALAGLCKVLVHRYDISKSSGSFEEAEKVCHRAWTVDATMREVQLSLGHLYKASGQPGKAREAYIAALDTNPNDLWAQVSLAGTYIDDNPDLAEVQLKRIVHQHPGSPHAYSKLQYLYFRQGRYAEAIEPAQWAVSLDPSSDAARFSLAVNLGYAGRLEEAKTLLKEMVNANSPRMASVKNNLGTFLYFDGDYAEAATLYRDSVERTPDKSLNQRNFGDAVWQLEGRDSAEPIFKKAIEVGKRQLDINPSDYWVISDLVVAYASIGDLANFHRAKDTLLEFHGEDPQSHYDIAIGASRIGNMDLAREHAKTARELGYPIAFLRADPDIIACGEAFQDGVPTQ